MQTKTYELIVKTNKNMINFYDFVGPFISGQVEKKEVHDGECSFDVEDVMAAYTAHTKESYEDYDWWSNNICFKGEQNTTPYELTTAAQSFHDSNFPSIKFSSLDSESSVRDKIKQQFFKKFNTIVDRVDKSSLINDVKVRIDSDIFNEQFSREYCYGLLAEYELLEKMFDSYVIKKIESNSFGELKTAITFHLKEAPTKKIVDNMIKRIHYLVENYDYLMEVTQMDGQCYFPENIDEAIEDSDNFAVVGVDLIEHVTTTSIKSII